MVGEILNQGGRSFLFYFYFIFYSLNLILQFLFLFFGETYGKGHL